MRIRFYTRTQAVCLAVSLFLAVFVLGLALGFALTGWQPAPQGAVEAFAPLENTPLSSSLPTSTPLPSQLNAELNLFAIGTPTPTVTTVLSNTPSFSFTMFPFQTPGPVVTQTPQPGGFNITVIQGPGMAGSASGKRILIYHTHTYEAYKPTAENQYESTQEWRTKDERYNVVRVGEELTRLLTAAGFVVVHDTTAYEPPKFDTAYARSLKMLEDSMARGEKFDLYIDLHRNAYSDSMANHNVVTVGDQKIARLMMLIGKGTAGFDVKPEWEKNLAIAQAVTDALNEQIPDICKPVSVKSSRYNQHVAPCCILIEAGNNGNTLEEVLASTPYLADAIRTALSTSAPKE